MLSISDSVFVDEATGLRFHCVIGSDGRQSSTLDWPTHMSMPSYSWFSEVPEPVGALVYDEHGLDFNQSFTVEFIPGKSGSPTDVSIVLKPEAINIRGETYRPEFNELSIGRGEFLPSVAVGRLALLPPDLPLAEAEDYVLSLVMP